MISIIISSYNPEYLFAVHKSIEETIGVPYELIKIDNPGLMSICTAYNQGANQAKYENLLFIHEDILFHTKNWGPTLIEKLALPKTGVVGVAGSIYTPKTPGEWWLIKENNRLNLIQHIEPGKIITFKSEYDDAKVRTIDGVFLACKKEVYQAYSFNENLKGFHGYDIDFCNRVALEYQNYVTNQILIEHFSNGTDSKKWFETLLTIHDQLSLKKPNFNFELRYYINLKERLINYNYGYFKTIFILTQSLKFKYFDYKSYRIALVKLVKFALLKK